MSRKRAWYEPQAPGSTLRRLRRRVDRLEAKARQEPIREVPPLDQWLDQVSPEYRWDWPHLVYLRERLLALHRGDIHRLAIFMPPRHMKTSLSTQRFPIWCLEQDLRFRIILGAYNQTYAEEMSGEMRKIARRRFALARDKQAVKSWKTVHGGGVRACGVGSPPTGQGANLLVIDDPIKSSEEAESPTLREKVWAWYSKDLLTRVEPGGRILLILTRWHTDDLAGRILNSEDAPNWTVVRLPAIAEENDPLGRAPGEALCPERYPLETLESRRRDMGDYAFQSLYQQNPTPRLGNLFKLAWFNQFTRTIPAGSAFVRYWDKAGTAGGGCYTAGVLMARDKDKHFYIVDVRRKQLDAAEREAWILSTAHEDKQKWGRVEIGIEREGGSGGKESARATIRMLAGFPCFEDCPTGSKEARAEPLASQFGGGNVWFYAPDGVAPPWYSMFRDEALAFPRGKYLDMVDGASGAFARLNMGNQSPRILL